MVKVSDNFYELLRARFHPSFEKPFLTAPEGANFTYGDIDALSAKMAGALVAGGAQPGDRVMVQVEKSPENVALYLGAMRAGLIYVPLNTAYTSEEVEYFLNDAEPAIFVCDPKNETDLAPIAKRAGVSQLLTLSPDGGGTLKDAAREATGLSDICVRHEDDLAVILYTSGTTGRSKGAMLSHGNLASNALVLNDLWGFTPNDVLLHALPVFHIHGLFVALHTAMLSACEILFLLKFEVAAIRQQLPRATMMMGVPTFYTRLLHEGDFGRNECAHMRLFVSGSAPLTVEAFDTFDARTGHNILERYGMSEAGMIASNPLDGDRIAGTVGYALPGVNLRIVDDSDGIAPTDVPGNIEICGPNLFKGYWRNPEKTKEAFREDGFFITGDIGSIDETGRLTLQGRSKDLIIAGGYNIYPKEIEEALDAVPGIVESAVIGAPHADMGEGVVAILVGADNAVSESALNKAIAGLARFKHPRKYIWLDALPRNAMGKVQKQALREQFKDTFAAPQSC